MKSLFGKKRGKTNDTLGGGSSIQEKIDALRQEQNKKGEPQRVKNGDSPSAQPSAEEEEFLKKFAERVQNQSQRRAPSLPESLAEASRDMREALSRRTRDATPLPTPARQEPPVVAAPQPAQTAARGAAGPPVPSAVAVPQAAQPAAPSSTEHPPEGAILHLSGGENVVFCRDVPNKSYQLVVVLDPDGSVHAEGVYLAAYEYRQIGSLPVEHLERLRDERRWDRDLIVYHLDRYDDAALIARPGQPEPADAPAAGPKIVARREDNGRAPNAKPEEPKSDRSYRSNRSDPPDRFDEEHEPVAPNGSRIPEETREEPREEEGDIRSAAAFGRPVSLRNKLFRGRRFTIKFGNRTWEAVYWGEDEQGAVVAHDTNGQWSLMHLDLSRFRDSLVLKDEVSDRERRDLEKSLLRARS